MVDSLEHTVAGMKEFLFFLELYPRMLREPYGTYLFLDNCIFGRQTERRRILNFLMCPSATPDLAILPIVGPIRVGKSTLVENICRDDSVRDRFSMILFFPEGSLKDERVVNLRLREDAPVYCWRLVKRHRYFFICNHHQSESSENVPKINRGKEEACASRGRTFCLSSTLSVTHIMYVTMLSWSSNGEEVVGFLSIIPQTELHFLSY